MQYISLVRYENWPVDGCVSVCLVLTIDVNGLADFSKAF